MKKFRLTSFGESHGKAIGGIIEGCPSNLKIDFEFIKNELNRRKPNQSSITTSRKEDDKLEFLSGIFKGKTLGTPIAFIVWNKDQKEKDYEDLKNVFRPSHADFTYQQKYGIRDHRGGGRASARETIARVVAGAIAKLILRKLNIKINAYVNSVGEIELLKNYKDLDFNKIEENIIRCPDEKLSLKMIEKIKEVQKKGDTIGGTIFCVIQNVPAGFGEPVFEKLQANLAKALMSINAVKGFEYGSGFAGTKMIGSEHNDIFYMKNGKIRTKTNFSGGIQGGISNGEDIYFKLAFKPIPSLMKPQYSVNEKFEKVIINPKGRHDTCVLPRVVVIVEAMSAIVLADFYLCK